MKLFVTGASSFVGAHFCRLAAERGHEVVGLCHHTALALPGVSVVRSPIATVAPPVGTDVVVHLAAKVMADDAREQNRHMLDAVLAWGRPVVYASSTVVNWPVRLAYADARIEDEARVQASGLPWLVVRPCAPYGPRMSHHTPAHRESFHQLGDWVSRSRLVPVIGSARVKRQPVHVDDFNGAILGLLGRGSWGAPFDAGGPDPLSMGEIIAALAAVRGRRVHTVGIPVPIAVRAARLLPGFRTDLVAAFATDDVVDREPLRIASGVDPRPFDAAAVFATV